MAKQSGLHQIKGKVGEHSYYQQTGVVGGLVRRINQGLSEKVKTAEAFVNTRLNNAEFGQAARIAAVLAKFIEPKYRPMILPFSQSKMAKQILEVIKQDTSGAWGQRNIPQDATDVLLSALNSVHKIDPAVWGMSASVANDVLTLEFNSTFVASQLAAIGADGFNLRVLACRPWIGKYSQTDAKYSRSYARANIYDQSTTPGNYFFEIDYEFRPAPPSGWPAIYFDFFVVIIMPYRTINNVKHILQEHCTFDAIEVPASE